MTGRERLMATLRGEPVDRPAVSFYEIGGFTVDPADPDEYNIYNDQSWQPLLQLAEERTDVMRMAAPAMKPSRCNREAEFFRSESYEHNGSRYTRLAVTIAGRTLTSLTRRDPAVSTVWTLEHLLKDTDDLKAYLELPEGVSSYEPDTSVLARVAEEVGDRGIIMLETADPICIAASLFSMADYTVIALTEPDLFHALLTKIAEPLYKVVSRVAQEAPGHLWRICGPEYATEPYLPPRLFEEYVVRYTGPIVQSIEENGGFARLHCHGRIKSALPYFAAMGVSGTDPIEPQPQGDVELDWVRREYGRDMVLFGNIEVADIENMAPRLFEKVVEKTLQDGTSGEGRGFVLMPSSSPYGRTITPTTMANYETMVRMAEQF